MSISRRVTYFYQNGNHHKATLNFDGENAKVTNDADTPADCGILKEVQLEGMAVRMTYWQWWLLEICEYLTEFCEEVYLRNHDPEHVLSDINRKQGRLPLDIRDISVRGYHDYGKVSLNEDKSTRTHYPFFNCSEE
jgi:hypothetical protein